MNDPKDQFQVSTGVDGIFGVLTYSNSRPMNTSEASISFIGPNVERTTDGPFVIYNSDSSEILFPLCDIYTSGEYYCIFIINRKETNKQSLTKVSFLRKGLVFFLFLIYKSLHYLLNFILFSSSVTNILRYQNIDFGDKKLLITLLRYGRGFLLNLLSENKKKDTFKVEGLLLNDNGTYSNAI